MTAAEFLKAFLPKVKDLPKAHGVEWTTGIYPVVWEIGNTAGFVVNCKPFDHKGKIVGYREINDMDFMYFPHENRPNERTFHSPAAVLEHENAWDEDATFKDFRKLCRCAAPLRVMIGYSRNEARARATGSALTEFYDQYRYRQLVDGETLILMSWNRKDDIRRWHVWLLQGEGKPWVPLTCEGR